MSLREFFILIKHYWWQAVMAIVLMILLCLGGQFFMASKKPVSYTSSAVLVSNILGSSLLGIASSEGVNAAEENSGYRVVAELEEGTENVLLSTTGPNADESSTICNDTMTRVCEIASELYPGIDKASLESGPHSVSVEGFKGYVSHLETVENPVQVNYLIGTLFGLLGGAIIVSVALIAFDMKRRPIIDGEEVSEAFNIRLLGSSSSPGSVPELLAHVRFATAEESVSELIVVPVGCNESALSAVEELKGLEGIDVSEFSYSDFSVFEDLERLSERYVILSGCQWKDNLFQVERVSKALHFNRVKVIGFVLV